MPKKYYQIKIDKETRDNIINKQLKLNSELNSLGIKKKVKKIAILRELSAKPLYLEKIEIIKLAKKKRI